MRLAERKGFPRRDLSGRDQSSVSPLWPHSTAVTRADGLPGPTVSLYIAFGNIGKNHKNNKHVISKVEKEHKAEGTGGNKS